MPATDERWESTDAQRGVTIIKTECGDIYTYIEMVYPIRLLQKKIHIDMSCAAMIVNIVSCRMCAKSG